MSPIGRVFIVLNLVLAGGFVAFSGTHLQQQSNYKTKLETVEKVAAEKQKVDQETITKLETERNQFENAKTANETQLNERNVALDRARDEITRLTGTLGQLEADQKQLVASNGAIAAELKTAMANAKAGFDMAIADQKTKDESVRAKDDAQAENAKLKRDVAALEASVKDRESAIGDLKKERNELGMLVKVAETNGFLRSMAAPTLAGLVTSAGGRLCTIQISENPGNIDIASEIEKGKWGFAIYDASGYKGEAIATKYEASANAVLCNVYLVKGEIKEGDRASTKTP